MGRLVGRFVVIGGGVGRGAMQSSTTRHGRPGNSVLQQSWEVSKRVSPSWYFPSFVLREEGTQRGTKSDESRDEMNDHSQASNLTYHADDDASDAYQTPHPGSS